jgi:hypothetical protein
MDGIRLHSYGPAGVHFIETLLRQGRPIGPPGAAHEALEGRNTMGKVILVPWPAPRRRA